MEILPVDLHLLDPLRVLQAAQLHGPVQAHDEAAIAQPGALHLGLFDQGRLQGYACYSPEDHRQSRTLLEIFVRPGARRLALPFLREALAWVPPARWHVNSYDRFALSLAVNAGYPLDRTAAFVFTCDDEAKLPQGPHYDVRPAARADLGRMRPILEQDGFYTVPWDRLPAEVEAGLWHLLLSPAATLVGVGYLEPLKRTPAFADIGLVVAAEWRGKGMGLTLLRGLVAEGRRRGLEPVAVCARDNTASRRLLERGGFYSDGRIWSVRIQASPKEETR